MPQHLGRCQIGQQVSAIAPFVQPENEPTGQAAIDQPQDNAAHLGKGKSCDNTQGQV